MYGQQESGQLGDPGPCLSHPGSLAICGAIGPTGGGISAIRIRSAINAAS
jgi:hypothetical protein